MVAGYASPFCSQTDRDLFPSPWQDVATPAMPENYRHALDLCEFLFYGNTTYAEAQKRLVSYFLTNVEVQATDDDHPVGNDERDTWKRFLTDTVEMMAVIDNMNMDKACYGNSFASLRVPFKRFLVSTGESRLMLAMEDMARQPGVYNLAYDAGGNKFMAKDPKSGSRCEWQVKDILKDEVKIKVWSPKQIEIVYDDYSEECQYLWRIPAEYKRDVKNGNLHVLAQAPLEVLKAIHKNQFFMFERDALYHMKERTLSGVKMRGWGLSRVLINYRDIRYVQVLRRYNEALAMDYIIPFRVITPEVRPGGSIGATPDPLLSADQEDFNAAVRRMIRERRKHPTSWNTIPYPIRYQALGGDANMLAPHELTAQANDLMLNASGAPAEFYRGNLSFQVAPVTLRLMEASHHSIVHDNNKFLRWFVSRASQLVSLPAVRLQMKRVTHADDFNKTMLAMQMFMGQQLSGRSAMESLGYEWSDEQRQIGEEEMFKQHVRADIQEEMQQADFGSQMAKGQVQPQQPGAQGAPPQQAGVAGTGTMGIGSPVQAYLASMTDAITPQELIAQAESLASDLMGLPETQRLSEMRQLKEKHEALHAMVKVKLQEMRQQAQSSGGAMMLGQQPPAAAA